MDGKEYEEFIIFVPADGVKIASVEVRFMPGDELPWRVWYTVRKDNRRMNVIGHGSSYRAAQNDACEVAKRQGLAEVVP